MSTSDSLSISEPTPVSQRPQGVIPVAVHSFGCEVWPAHIGRRDADVISHDEIRASMTRRPAEDDEDTRFKFFDHEMPPEEEIVMVVGLPPEEFQETVKEHSKPPQEYRANYYGPSATAITDEQKIISLSNSLDLQVGEVQPLSVAKEEIRIPAKSLVRKLQTICAFLALVIMVLGGLVVRKFQTVMHNVTVTAAQPAASPEHHPTLWVPPPAAIPDEEPAPRMPRLKMDGLTEIPPLRTLADKAEELPPPAPQSTFHIDKNI